MKLTILVPTYRRCKDLERCLDALKRQVRPADEVLVVVRDVDEATHHFLTGFATEGLPMQIVDVTVPGQVAALNAGLSAATGEIIAITDDDAAPHPDWLERIEGHFLADERIGGVGGRDLMYVNAVLQDASIHPGASNIVGKLEWFGRTIGNHHIGIGETREVDILKGANMSYRRSAVANLRFNVNLKGAGAQAHNDMDFSLSVKRKGWKIVYDPTVAVDHFLAERLDSDQRTLGFNYEAMLNSTFNETWVILNYLPNWRRIVFILWSILIGSRSNQGLLQVVRFLAQERRLSLKQALAAISGKWQGCLAWWAYTRNSQ
jgi:cellulose synthase/poly-beta-1,6-N-acetylglucosamine synthase-like glycosyltransferase